MASLIFGLLAVTVGTALGVHLFKNPRKGKGVA